MTDESGDIVAMNNLNEVEEVAEQETPEIETTEKQEEQAEGEVKSKRPTGFQRKISKLEQQNAQLEARLAELSKPKVNSDKPNIDNFESFDAYNEALLDWKVDQREAVREQKIKEAEEQKEAKAREAKTLSEWEQKEDSLGDDLDEYEELVAKNSKTSFRQELIQATFESDLGPQIRHYLLKNPEELAKVNTAELSSYAIYKKVAELESKLSIKPTVKVSKSSEPITPVRGTSKTAVKLDNLDTDSYIAQRYPSIYGKK